MQHTQWILPDGIEELLPQQTKALELARKRLLSLFDCWGYDLVVTPIIEYLDSLLTGTGADLDLVTFKLLDQQSGRMLGLRADMTPQAARIDAHRLRHDSTTRLCYLGTVLHTLPAEHGGSRSPMQAGAELYGSNLAASDIEIVQLMLASLRALNVGPMVLDIGHVAIYRTLVTMAQLDSRQEHQLSQLLSSKAVHELHAFCGREAIEPKITSMIVALSQLDGDYGVLAEAEQVFANVHPDITAALQRLQQVYAGLAENHDIRIHFDLSELRGYHYHTGLLFAVYTEDDGRAIAQGGRYDDIGKIFGRSRAATGFSLDLRPLLFRSGFVNDITSIPAILVPVELATVDGVAAKIAELRDTGVRVVQQFDATVDTAEALGCQQLLRRENGEWLLQPLQ